MSSIQLDPPVLTFHPGFRGTQRLSFRIVPHRVPGNVPGERVPVRVELSAPADGTFSWATRLEHHGQLALGAIEVEVEFTRDPAAPPVAGCVEVRVTDDTGRPLAGGPLRCELRGNVPGVGPGALSIEAFVPHQWNSPTYRVRRSNDLLFVTNNTPVDLDLTQCTLSEYAPVDAPVETAYGTGYQHIFNGLILRPRASGDTLRLWRGGLPPDADPRLDVALPPRRVMRHTRDMAWIKNRHGQLVDSCTYVAATSEAVAQSVAEGTSARAFAR